MCTILISSKHDVVNLNLGYRWWAFTHLNFFFYYKLIKINFFNLKICNYWLTGTKIKISIKFEVTIIMRQDGMKRMTCESFQLVPPTGQIVGRAKLKIYWNKSTHARPCPFTPLDKAHWPNTWSPRQSWIDLLIEFDSTLLFATINARAYI